jgi:protein TonB
VKRRLTFTIYHGLLASLAIHTALATPFALPRWTHAPDLPKPLVVEFKGVAADRQSDEMAAQETKGEETKDKTQAAKPEEAASSQPPEPDEQKAPVEQEDGRPVPSEERAAPVAEQRPEEAKTGQAGANDIIGATQRREARTIQADPITETDLIRNYLKLLKKKVQANLDSAHSAQLQGAPLVSFTVLANGQIRPGTLKIRASSGKPKLDAGALKTIIACAPFDPPPREMTVSIDVEFGDMDKW